MVWQDIVITLANVLFNYSLIYQVYRGFKEKKGFITIQTSLFTAIGLIAMAIAVFTLGLYISAAFLTISAAMWIILLLQRLTYKKA